MLTEGRTRTPFDGHHESLPLDRPGSWLPHESEIDDAPFESSISFTPSQARNVLSDKGYDLIVGFETGGEAYYNAVIKKRAHWAGRQVWA